MTQEELNKPVPPPEPGQAAAQFGPTAAQNLLTALSDLRNTQNNFMSVWLNYYATRMQLMRELGLMQLDEQGRWIDTPLSALERPAPEEIATPPAVPAEWMDETFWDDAVESVEPEDQQVEARHSPPVKLDANVHNEGDVKGPPPAPLHVLCTHVPDNREPPSKPQDVDVSDAGLPTPSRRVALGDEPVDRVPAVTPQAVLKPAGVRFLVPTNRR